MQAPRVQAASSGKDGSETRASQVSTPIAYMTAGGNALCPRCEDSRLEDNDLYLRRGDALYAEDLAEFGITACDNCDTPLPPRPPVPQPDLFAFGVVIR